MWRGIDGMNTRNGLKRPFLFGFFLVILSFGVIGHEPAAAACDGCVVSAVGTASTAEIANLRQTILGVNPVGMPMELGKTAQGVPIMVPGSGATIPYTSLTEYFENVWWPRMIVLEKLKAQEGVETNAVNQANTIRTQEGAGVNNWGQDIKRFDVRSQQEYSGADDVLCAPVSIRQSALAAEAISRYYADLDAKAFISEGNGSTDAKDAAKGPVQKALAAVKARNELGTCDPKGNDNGNAAACTNPKQALLNADQSPQTIFGTWLLQASDSSAANFDKVANNFKKIVFARNAISPVSGDASKDPRLAQLQADRDSYVANYTLFSDPLTQAIAERKEIEQMASAKSMLALLQRAGIDGSEMAKIANGDKISKASLDYARYKVMALDPQTSIQNLTQNGVNISRFMGETTLGQQALLYDIREELKKTNIILGAIGGVLMKNEYNDIQGMATATTSSSTN